MRIRYRNPGERTQFLRLAQHSERGYARAPTAVLESQSHGEGLREEPWAPPCQTSAGRQLWPPAPPRPTCTPQTHPYPPEHKNFHSFDFWVPIRTASPWPEGRSVAWPLSRPGAAALSQTVRATGKGDVAFRVQPDPRIQTAPALPPASLRAPSSTLSRHTLEDETPPASHTQTHAHTQLFFGRGASVLVLGQASGATWPGVPGAVLPSRGSGRERAEVCTGKAQAAVSVTGDRERHEAASPLPSNEERQASALHIPPDHLQKQSSATTTFWSPPCKPVPYKGLVEYCWMSRW